MTADDSGGWDERNSKRQGRSTRPTMNEKENETLGGGIDRRTVLQGMGTATAASILGLPVLTGSTAAATEETLYLTDSGGDNGGEFLTKLYEVDLDSTSERANLDLKLEITNEAFDQVDAIAATPDGATIHMVDKNSWHLGEYDVGNDSFSDLGVVQGISEAQVVLASYSPDGTLYVAGQANDTIYTVDPSTQSASVVTTVDGADVQGADLAFDADGNLFLYSSASEALYTVNLNGGSASKVGDTGGFFTGLAIRDGGNGALVGSSTTDDTIYEIDPDDGSKGPGFELYRNNERYAYGFGDMTVGALDTCTECSSGDELLAKYEFECVEEEDDECLDHDFVLEKGDDSLIGYEEEDYTVKEGDESEPMTATFQNTAGYCELVAVVKAGPEVDVQEVSGYELTVEAPDKYAISNIRFYCEAPEDTSVGNGEGSGSGNGRDGNGRGGNGRGGKGN